MKPSGDLTISCRVAFVLYHLFNSDSNLPDFSDTDLFIYSADDMPASAVDIFAAMGQDKPYNRECLDGFVELMAEVCNSRRESIRINQENVRTDIVKNRFQKLDSGHIRYVLDCLDRNTTAIGNIHAYILSTLFNAAVADE